MPHIWVVYILRVFFITLILTEFFYIYFDYISVIGIQGIHHGQSKNIQAIVEDRKPLPPEELIECLNKQILPQFLNAPKLSKGSLIPQEHVVTADHCQKLSSLEQQYTYNQTKSMIYHNLLVIFDHYDQVIDLLDVFQCYKHFNMIMFYTKDQWEARKQDHQTFKNQEKIMGFLKWRQFQESSLYNPLFIDAKTKQHYNIHSLQSLNSSPFRYIIGKIKNQQSDFLEVIPGLIKSGQVKYILLDITELTEDLSLILSQIGIDLENVIKLGTQLLFDIQGPLEVRGKLWVKLVVGSQQIIDQSQGQEINFHIKGQMVKNIFDLSQNNRFTSLNSDNSKSETYSLIKHQARYLCISNTYNIMLLTTDSCSASQIESDNHVISMYQLIRYILQVKEDLLPKQTFTIKAYLSSTNGDKPSLSSQLLIYLGRQLWKNGKQKVTHISVLVDNSQLLGKQTISKNWKIFQILHRELILNDIDYVFEATFIGNTVVPPKNIKLTLPTTVIPALPLKYANLLVISPGDSETQLKNILDALETRKSKSDGNHLRIISAIITDEQLKIAKNLVRRYLQRNFKCQLLVNEAKSPELLNFSTDVKIGYLIVHSIKVFEKTPSQHILAQNSKALDHQEPQTVKKPKPIIENPLLTYINSFKIGQSLQLYQRQWFRPLSQSLDNDLKGVFSSAFSGKQSGCLNNLKAISYMNRTIFLSEDVHDEYSYITNKNSLVQFKAEEYKRMLGQVKSGQSVRLQVYDEILSLLIAHKISQQNFIIHNITQQLDQKLKKFTIINDIGARFINEDDGQSKSPNIIFTVASQIQKLSPSDHAYIKYNKDELKYIRKQCEPVYSGEFSQWCKLIKQ